MASRAILRARRRLSQHLNVPGHSYLRCLSFGPCRLDCNADSGFLSWVPEHGSIDTECRNEREAVFLAKQDLMGLSASLFHKHASRGISVVGCRYGKTETVLPVGLRGLTPSVRTASTATVRQPDIGDGDEDNEDQEQKHGKAASAEECDQAVEGLSMAK